jgi:hypothetical protein
VPLSLRTLPLDTRLFRMPLTLLTDLQESSKRWQAGHDLLESGTFYAAGATSSSCRPVLLQSCTDDKSLCLKKGTSHALSGRPKSSPTYLPLARSMEDRRSAVRPE